MSLFPRRYYFALSAASIIVLLTMLATMTLVIGVAGREPEISVDLQESYRVGEKGYIALKIVNRWWARNITVISVTISIAQGKEMQLLGRQEPVSNLQERVLLLELTVPQGTPAGSYSYVIGVTYVQSRVLFTGQEIKSAVISGAIVLRY